MRVKRKKRGRFRMSGRRLRGRIRMSGRRLRGIRRNALEIGQWVSAAIIAGGIVCEVIYTADVYLVAITVGTFSWAIVQKVKHPNRNKEDK